MTQPTDPPTASQHPAPPPQDPEGAGGPENGSEWPLRGRGAWRAEDMLTVLRGQAPLHPPLGYPYNVALPWAYDTIRELTGAVRALSLPPHFTDVSIEGTEGPWRTGQSVVPKVTLYKGNQIVGLALSAEIAAEIVARCNATEAGPQVITNTETRTLSAGDAEIDFDALTLVIVAASRYLETPNSMADTDINRGQLSAAVADVTALHDALDPA